LATAGTRLPGVGRGGRWTGALPTSMASFSSTRSSPSTNDQPAPYSMKWPGRRASSISCSSGSVLAERRGGALIPLPQEGARQPPLGLRASFLSAPTSLRSARVPAPRPRTAPIRSSRLGSTRSTVTGIPSAVASNGTARFSSITANGALLRLVVAVDSSLLDNFLEPTHADAGTPGFCAVSFGVTRESASKERREQVRTPWRSETRLDS